MNNPFNDLNLARRGLFHHTSTHLNHDNSTNNITLIRSLAEEKKEINEETERLQSISLEDLKTACKNDPELESVLEASLLFNLSLTKINKSLSFFDRLRSASTLILHTLNLTHLKEVNDTVPLRQTILWYAISTDAELSNTSIEDLDAYEARFKQISSRYSGDQNHPHLTQARAQRELFWKTIESRLCVLRINQNEFPSQNSPHKKIRDILMATHKDLREMSSQLTVSACRLIKDEVIMQLDLPIFEPNEDEEDSATCERQQEVYQYLNTRLKGTNTENKQLQLAIPDDWVILDKPTNRQLVPPKTQAKELAAPDTHQPVNHKINDYSSIGSIGSIADSVENMITHDQLSTQELIKQHQAHHYTDHFITNFNIAAMNQDVIDQLFHRWKFNGFSKFIPVEHNGEVCYEFVWHSLKATKIEILYPDGQTIYPVQITNGRGFIGKHLVDMTFNEALRRFSLVHNNTRSELQKHFKLAPELIHETLEQMN